MTMYSDISKNRLLSKRVRRHPMTRYADLFGNKLQFNKEHVAMLSATKTPSYNNEAYKSQMEMLFKDYSETRYIPIPKHRLQSYRAFRPRLLKFVKPKRAY